MEQLNENIYEIDLSEADTAPDIIFQLSSILDKDETRNKRICLKLGNVNLNQAQLLSIKSLISGIDSTLSLIDTKSTETEKVALSLGMIISNISPENITEAAPEMPYKMADELKEEQNNFTSETESKKVCESDIVLNKEQASSQTQNLTDLSSENFSLSDKAEIYNETLNIGDKEEIKEEILTSEKQEPICDVNEISNEEDISVVSEKSDNKEINQNVQDELDVIFNSSFAQNTFYEMESTESEYEPKEELTDIVVPEAEYTKEDIELESFQTKYIKQTIRSGQVINFEGNLVIIGDCHPGSEITALGDITVWGILSGIAHAGAGGNQKARVRALKMNAIQLRIASCYSRRPDSLNTAYIEKTNSFTPEEARIVNNEIVVFKIND